MYDMPKHRPSSDLINSLVNLHSLITYFRDKKLVEEVFGDAERIQYLVHEPDHFVELKYCGHSEIGYAIITKKLWSMNRTFFNQWMDTFQMFDAWHRKTSESSSMWEEFYKRFTDAYWAVDRDWREHPPERRIQWY